MNGTVEPVGDESAEKRLRFQSRRIYVESAIAALILTGLSFFFASVLPEAARSFPDLSLEQAAEFLIRHGYAVLFGWVLLEQLGSADPGCSAVDRGRRAGPRRQNELGLRGDVAVRRDYFGRPVLVLSRPLPRRPYTKATLPHFS